jgi:trimethylamine-N-oxide reductase (cytochrome c)
MAKSYKINDREPVMLNEADADTFGIKHGDIVEIYNDRGKILAGAYITDDIVKGVIAVAEGAWYSAENPLEKDSTCVSGQVNVLTSDRPTSSFAQAISANTCLVAIRKFAGEPPRNNAYDNPVVLERYKKG